MTSILHPTYFPNLSHFIVLVNFKNNLWELHDNYQKQTLRNRMVIYAANGSLPLSIPVIYSQKNRQLYQDIKISNTENWQSHHWKSIESAYRTSPFFEFYEDNLKPLFNTKPEFLLEHNLNCFNTICECLQISPKIENTTNYIKHPEHLNDYRYLVNSRKVTLPPFQTYTQVFSNKHGFISNLSILDLLFNEGPNTISYLQNQTINSNE